MTTAFDTVLTFRPLSTGDAAEDDHFTAFAEL